METQKTPRGTAGLRPVAIADALVSSRTSMDPEVFKQVLEQDSTKEPVASARRDELGGARGKDAAESGASNDQRKSAPKPYVSPFAAWYQPETVDPMDANKRADAAENRFHGPYNPLPNKVLGMTLPLAGLGTEGVAASAAARTGTAIPAIPTHLTADELVTAAATARLRNHLAHDTLALNQFRLDSDNAAAEVSKGDKQDLSELTALEAHVRGFAAMKFKRRGRVEDDENVEHFARLLALLDRAATTYLPYPPEAGNGDGTGAAGEPIAGSRCPKCQRLLQAPKLEARDSLPGVLVNSTIKRATSTSVSPITHDSCDARRASANSIDLLQPSVQKYIPGADLSPQNPHGAVVPLPNAACQLLNPTLSGTGASLPTDCTTSPQERASISSRNLAPNASLSWPTNDVCRCSESTRHCFAPHSIVEKRQQSDPIPFSSLASVNRMSAVASRPAYHLQTNPPTSFIRTRGDGQALRSACERLKRKLQQFSEAHKRGSLLHMDEFELVDELLDLTPETPLTDDMHRDLQAQISGEHEADDSVIVSIDPHTGVAVTRKLPVKLVEAQRRFKSALQAFNQLKLTESNEQIDLLAMLNIERDLDQIAHDVDAIAEDDAKFLSLSRQQEIAYIAARTPLLTQAEKLRHSAQSSAGTSGIETDVFDERAEQEFLHGLNMATTNYLPSHSVQFTDVLQAQGPQSQSLPSQLVGDDAPPVPSPSLSPSSSPLFSSEKEKADTNGSAAVPRVLQPQETGDCYWVPMRTVVNDLSIDERYTTIVPATSEKLYFLHGGAVKWGWRWITPNAFKELVLPAMIPFASPIAVAVREIWEILVARNLTSIPVDVLLSMILNVAVHRILMSKILRTVDEIEAEKVAEHNNAVQLAMSANQRRTSLPSLAKQQDAPHPWTLPPKTPTAPMWLASLRKRTQFVVPLRIATLLDPNFLPKLMLPLPITEHLPQSHSLASAFQAKATLTSKGADLIPSVATCDMNLIFNSSIPHIARRGAMVALVESKSVARSLHPCAYLSGLIDTLGFSALAPIPGPSSEDGRMQLGTCRAATPSRAATVPMKPILNELITQTALVHRLRAAMHTHQLQTDRLFASAIRFYIRSLGNTPAAKSSVFLRTTSLFHAGTQSKLSLLRPQTAQLTRSGKTAFAETARLADKSPAGRTGALIRARPQTARADNPPFPSGSPSSQPPDAYTPQVTAATTVTTTVREVMEWLLQDESLDALRRLSRLNPEGHADNLSEQSDWIAPACGLLFAGDDAGVLPSVLKGRCVASQGGNSRADAASLLVRHIVGHRPGFWVRLQRVLMDLARDATIATGRNLPLEVLRPPATLELACATGGMTRPRSPIRSGYDSTLSGRDTLTDSYLLKTRDLTDDIRRFNQDVVGPDPAIQVDLFTTPFDLPLESLVHAIHCAERAVAADDAAYLSHIFLWLCGGESPEDREWLSALGSLLLKWEREEIRLERESTRTTPESPDSSDLQIITKLATYMTKQQANSLKLALLTHPCSAATRDLVSARQLRFIPDLLSGMDEEVLGRFNEDLLNLEKCRDQVREARMAYLQEREIWRAALREERRQERQRQQAMEFAEHETEQDDEADY